MRAAGVVPHIVVHKSGHPVYAEQNNGRSLKRSHRIVMNYCLLLISRNKRSASITVSASPDLLREIADQRKSTSPDEVCPQR
jgi:hypothetical protein